MKGIIPNQKLSQILFLQSRHGQTIYAALHAHETVGIKCRLGTQVKPPVM
jgi:hypothetical protein